MTRVFGIAAFIVLCIGVEPINAQQTFKTPDSLVYLMYDVLSGKSGDHNWEIFKTLFHEKAVLGSASVDKQGVHTFKTFSPAEYMMKNEAFFRDHEFSIKETHKVKEQLGDIIHIFSTYEYRADTGTPGMGINSFQIVYEGDRWWIISVQWTNERVDLPIPKIYGGTKK